MANVNAPFGFRHLGVLGGVSPNFGMVARKIASADTADIFTNGPVKSLSTGYVAAWTAGTAVSQLAGICVGFQYLNTSLGRQVFTQYWQGGDNTGDGTALIIPCNLGVAPTFLVQSSGTAITIADIGANADVTMGTGNTITGVSGASLDQSTLAATATLPFRVVGLYNGVGNGSDTTTSYNWVIVAANVSGAGSTGI